jgi:alkylhydroperoxidase family enzyme
LKDVRLALAAGDAVNTPLPVASLVRDSLLDALAHDEGDKDFAVLGKVAARRAQRQTAVENDRFPRVSKELLPDNQRAVYEGIEGRRGKIPAPYFALLSSPDVADLFEQYSTLLWDGVLPRDILEAVFLATAVRYRCRFQWMNHVDRALDAGLSADAMETIGRGSVPDQPDDLACVLKFVDMLAREHRVSDALFDAVTQRFGKQGVAELVAFCGVSVSIAMLLNVRQPDLPKGKAAPF